MREERLILARARARTSGSGLTDEERETLSSFKRGKHAPWLGKTDPIPLLPVAQLYARDVPGLPRPEGTDLLQVFWCPFEAHGESRALHVHLHWRDSNDAVRTLASQPEPEVVGDPDLVPSPCVVHPEEVTEHEYLDLLDEELRESIDAWEGPEEDEGPQYIYDLSVAPGWKVGGYASWPLTGPAVPECECGGRMDPLLTISEREWDPGTLSWVPFEDQSEAGNPGANTPTDVYAGRGRLFIFTCSQNVLHPHRLISQ